MRWRPERIQTHPTLFVLAILAIAGCIEVPASERETFSAAAVPDDRVDGMTAEETKEDSIVACNPGSTLDLPPGTCAQRILAVEGRIGVDRLPVQLVTNNGGFIVRAGEGDAWSLLATIVVRGPTEDMARDGLDTAWEWGHEAEGGHAVYARPVPLAEGVPGLRALSTSVVSATYELTLPSWIVLDVQGLTTNGEALVDGFEMGEVDIETTNGEIALAGAASDVRLATSNGEIVARLTPTARGSWSFSTTNGEILLGVPEGRSYGYDVAARTQNGDVEILLEDGQVVETEDGATFRTDGYDDRALRTSVELQTSNGEIVVGA